MNIQQSILIIIAIVLGLLNTNTGVEYVATLCLAMCLGGFTALIAELFKA